MKFNVWPNGSDQPMRHPVMSELKPEPCAELEIFWMRLARNTCAGVTLSESFRQLDEELAGTSIGAVVSDLRIRVDAGESLHLAMARHPEVFGGHVVDHIPCRVPLRRP